MKPRLKITISIDDVNPLPDWRIVDTPVQGWLTELHQEFGAMFSLFIPSHYHNHLQTKLSLNKGWINELENQEIFELAAHGHYHQTPNPKLYGEMEFAILNETQCKERLQLINDEWASFGQSPCGWRNPGWVCNPSCVPILSNYFDWVALHRDHNYGMEWHNSKMFFGCTDIQADEVVSTDGVLHFQSHIYGDHNKNVWNENNFETFNNTLRFLTTEYSVDFITFNDL